METCGCSRYLLIIERAPVTIRSSSSLTGLYQSRLGRDCPFYELEGHQLRSDLCHCQPASKNGTLQAGAYNDRCIRASGRLHAF